MAANDKLIRMTVRMPNNLYVKLRDHADAHCACKTKIVVKAVEVFLSTKK